MIRRIVSRWLAAGLLMVSVSVGRADDFHAGPPWVVDTDMGLDDVVALALLLQAPGIDIHGVVAADGVNSAEDAARFVSAMLREFNRPDVKLYASAGGIPREAPPFRGFARQAVGRALGAEAGPDPRKFVPEAYTDGDRAVNVLLLGPATNLAAALRRDAGLAKRLARVVVAGPRDEAVNWNLARDVDAWRAVRASGAAVTFVAPRQELGGQERARFGACLDGPVDSIGQRVVGRLLPGKDVRLHYLNHLAWHDEAAAMYAMRPAMFEARDELRWSQAGELSAAVVSALAEGRQRKSRVVFAEGDLPAAALHEELRSRAASMLAKNGSQEFFAQLIMNEVHDHLGAYSIVGVKMGLRAAELLNAPAHGMRVVAHVAPGPPASCINDGILVATGSTPGRALFEQGVPDPQRVSASFSYNGRTTTLALKARYRVEIGANIGQLVKAHGLESPAYWSAVRAMGLDIWENWHRRDLFEVVDSPGARPGGGG